MIDYLTHYYHRRTEPFRSLSALSDSEAIQIMKDLYVEFEGSLAFERFRDPVQYLYDRRQTEQWVREAFIAKGGQPQATYPIPMVLGTSKWMMKHAPDPDAHGEIRIPLSSFQEGDVSFTYPDSMISLWFGRDKPIEYYQPDYHGKVFTRSESLSIIEANGLPEEWETNLPDYLAPYIEAQVWNHKLLLAYKKQVYDDPRSKVTQVH
jgi:hypothetical protein